MTTTSSLSGNDLTYNIEIKDVVDKYNISISPGYIKNNVSIDVTKLVQSYFSEKTAKLAANGYRIGSNLRAGSNGSLMVCSWSGNVTNHDNSNKMSFYARLYVGGHCVREVHSTKGEFDEGSLGSFTWGGMVDPGVQLYVSIDDDDAGDKSIYYSTNTSTCITAFDF